MNPPRIALLIASAFVAVTAAPAVAQKMMQDAKPSLSRSEEAKKNDALFDQEFRNRRDGDSTPQAKADPWAGVRSEPAPPATTKKNNARN